MEINDSNFKNIMRSSDSRFPREGYPIAPKILSKVLNRQIPKKFSGEIDLKYEDLNKSIWKVFSKKTCKKLSKLVIKEVQKSLASNRKNISSIQIPPLPSGLSINDLPLEVRTFNCLARQKGFRLSKRNFVDCTVGDLMKIQNFGAKSLLDFLTSLEYAREIYTDSFEDGENFKKEEIEPELLNTFSQKIKRLKTLEYSHQILSSDIRLGKKIRSINKKSNSLRELADFLQDKSFVNSEDVRYTIEQIDDLLIKAKNISKIPLERELENIVQSIASERDSKIYIKRNGWDGKGERTLKDVGELFDLTRERARQICKKIDKVFSANHTSIFAPTLKRAISIIDKMKPCIASDFISELDRLNIIGVPFQVSGLLHASGTLEGKHYLLEAIQNSTKETIVSKDSEGLTKSLVSFTKKASRHWGALTIEELIAQFKEEKEFSLKKEFVVKVLNSRDDFTWLDKSNEWFWLKTTVSTRLMSRIKKILSVAESITSSDLRTCIRRDYQMEGFAPPKYVLTELCRQLPGYTVENEIITLDRPLKWEEVLDENEMLMVLVLKEEGPVLRRQELEEFCLDLGMNRNTLNRYLSHSPIIFRYGYMVYGLPNAEVDAAIIESLIPERKVSEVLEDFGWKNGKAWLGYRISKPMIRDGLFTVPSNMKKFIEGSFELKSSDGQTLGSLTIQESGAWGLVHLFKRRGGEAGDYLILEFDLSKKVTVARLGDESMIENFY
jgi:hypothetical protein